METNSLISIAGFEDKPGAEGKFIKWYDEVHIPMFLKSKNLKKVTRCQRLKNDDKYPEFMTIFEFDNEQAYEEHRRNPVIGDAAKDAIDRGWAKQGQEPRWKVQYKVVKTWSK